MEVLFSVWFVPCFTDRSLQANKQYSWPSNFSTAPRE